MLFLSFPSRGPGTHVCLSWPTKTRQHEGENVPAFVELLISGLLMGFAL